MEWTHALFMHWRPFSKNGDDFLLHIRRAVGRPADGPLDLSYCLFESRERRARGRRRLETVLVQPCVYDRL
jgi:hypothetical protein